MNKYEFFAVPFMILLYFAIEELMSLDETGKNENVEKFITFDELKDDLMKIEIKQRPVISRIAKASRKKSKVASMECLYYDADGNPADEHLACKAVLKSYDKKGKLVKEFTCGQIAMVYLYKNLADFAKE